MNVHILSVARQEVEEASDYYEEQRNGLGQEFILAFEKTPEDTGVRIGEQTNVGGSANSNENAAPSVGERHWGIGHNLGRSRAAAAL